MRKFDKIRVVPGTRGKILSILKGNRGSFMSGESISKELGLSRTAVWKHINVLRQEGYEIESLPKKGYRLLYSPDVLTLEEIEEYLNTEFMGRNVCYFDTLSSTNTKAKELAEEREGTIVVAEEQTKGKGRLGRTWISPKGKGIWVSILLKPDKAPAEVAKLTLIGAAAVNLALGDIGVESYIKWPNDIIVDGKKVCGILTEMSCELNRIDYVIMGIGINIGIDEADLGKELSKKAASLQNFIGDNRVNRKVLLARVLNHLEDIYISFLERGDISKAIDVSKDKSILLGKEIRILRGDKEDRAKALDIDGDGRLIVEHRDGRIESLFSGEISIRGMEGYI